MIFLAVFIGFALATISKKINSFPGFPGPLPSTWYSGFADTSPSPLGHAMFTHYVFVEAENNPATAPVVLWMNGGPGASSLFGMLVELGPLLLNAASMIDPLYNQTGIPQLQYNPFGWSKNANLLAIDFPPPVGFSYCLPAGVTGGGTSCGPWNDTSTSENNHRAMISIMKDFPQYANNPLFIIGESYAGVYVPTLAKLLLNDKQNNFNLQGIAVGDGCAGSDVLCGRGSGPLKRGNGPYYDLLFFYGHGQVSNALYNEINSVCTEQELRHGSLSSKCQPLIDQFQSSLGKFYAYDLYDDCNNNIFAKAKNLHKTSLSWGRPLPFGAHTGFYCPGSSMERWLSRVDVRLALGVQPNSNFFSEDNGNGFHYSTSERNVLPFYLDLMKNTNIRSLIYNGDSDPAINSFITQDVFFDYFKANNVPIKELWRPWTHVNNASDTFGYVQTYQGNFQFVTIRGSGHMVPEFKPFPAFVMLQSFLDNTELPKN